MTQKIVFDNTKINKTQLYNKVFQIKLSLELTLAQAMNHIKDQNDHSKTRNNEEKINSINAQLSARFEKYRSSPTSVTALIQVLQQKIRILAVNSNIPIPYCMEFQKSIIDKIRKIPQMNSSHVDYIQSIYNKEIQSLQNKTSFGHKVLNLMQQRSKILKDVKVMMVKQKISSNSGEKKPSLNLSYLGQNLSRLRDLSLGIIEHLSLWKSSLNSTGEDEYSKQTLQNISKDVQFLRSTPLRKFLQFASSQDPLFLYSMKKFWKLQLNTNYNSRAIMKLFEVSDSYKKRLLNAQKFTKCYDPNVVIYDYPFGESQLEGDNSDQFMRGQKTVEKLFQNQGTGNQMNFPSISQKNIPHSTNNKPQFFSSESRSIQTSPKKAFDLLKPIIDEAKLSKYHRPVNFRSSGENSIQNTSLKVERPSLSKQHYQRPNQSNTQAIRNFGPNRKHRVMTETQNNGPNDINKSINPRYLIGRNDVKDFDNSIQGKHKVYPPNDKRRKLKPIFKHSLSQYHENLGTALEALNAMEENYEHEPQILPFAKNEQGNSSKKTIKIPNNMPSKPEYWDNLKIKINRQLQNMNAQNEFMHRENNPNKKIYNKINTKYYQTEDEYEKQNLQMNSDLKKQMELQVIKKKQLELQKALKRYELEQKKKYKTIERSKKNDEPLNVSSNIRIKSKNTNHKSNRSKKMSERKHEFNPMNQDYEKSSSKQDEVSEFQPNSYQNVKPYARPIDMDSPERLNGISLSPKRKDYPIEKERFNQFNKSVQKSPKYSVRQVGKIKIVPLHYRNQGQLSPKNKNSLRQKGNLQRQKPPGRGYDQSIQLSNKDKEVKPDRSLEKCPNKILIEQSIQTSEMLAPSNYQQSQNDQFDPEGQNSKMDKNPQVVKKKEIKVQQRNNESAEVRNLSPPIASPYSQYLNQQIKDGERKGLLNSQNVKHMGKEKDENIIPKAYQEKMVQDPRQGSKPEMNKNPSLQKIKIQNKGSTKNLVQVKSDQKHSSISHYQSASKAPVQKSNEQIRIDDEPISDYELPKHPSRFIQTKMQNPQMKGSTTKSKLESLIDTRIQPQSFSTKKISPVKIQPNTYEQGKSIKTQANVPQIPVRQHEIYQVYEQGRSNQNESKNKHNEFNKPLSNRASSLLSNRSGNETHRSSISKSSSMKLESQTSQAIHKNAKNFIQPQYLTQQQSPNKSPINGKKLQTIQENQSYREVSQQNPTSPQYKSQNVPKIVPKLLQEKNASQTLLNVSKNSNKNNVDPIQNGQASKFNQQSPNKVNSKSPNLHTQSENQNVMGQDSNQINRNNFNKHAPKNPSNSNLQKQSAQNHLILGKQLEETKGNQKNKYQSLVSPQNSIPNQANLSNLSNGPKPKNPNQKSTTKSSPPEKKSYFEQAPAEKYLEIVKYPINVSQLSATAQKGSQYRKKDKQPQLSLSEDSSDSDQQEVNIYSKDQIVNKQKILPVKANNTSWSNPQNSMQDNARMQQPQTLKTQEESAKQGKINSDESRKLQNKNQNNPQPSTNNGQSSSNKNIIPISNSNSNPNNNLTNITSSQKKLNLQQKQTSQQIPNQTIKANTNQPQSSSFPEKVQSKITNQPKKLSSSQNPDPSVKLNSISHTQNDSAMQPIKLNTISHNNTNNNIILPQNTIESHQTIPQPNKTFANLSSIKSNPDKSQSNFVGNNSPLNLNLGNNHDTISSEDFSRKNTIESSPGIPKHPSKPNLNIITSPSPNKIHPSVTNPSPSNSAKNNEKVSNVSGPNFNRSDHPSNNPAISETNSENLTQNSEAKENAYNLTKCVFQSKSLPMPELSEFLAKYKVHEKIIEQIEQGYFSHRHLYLNLCLLNDEVISIVLSHPAFVGSQRIVYIVFFKVVSSKYHELSARLLSTTIKYLFFNDPCQNVICMKPKDEFLDENDKYIEKKFKAEVKNIKGKVKNSCIQPSYTGQVRPSVFEDTSYLINRKDMNCKNDEIYLNNVEFEVFIVGKKEIKIPQKAGKLSLSKNYQATIQKLFTSTQKTNLIKIFKSKAQLFQYTEEEEIGDFDNYKVLSSIKEHETRDLYLYQRHLCKLAPEVKYTSYGGVYYFFLEDRRTWYWEKNNIGYFFVKCQVKDTAAQQPGNEMASQMSQTSSLNDFSSFGGKNQEKKKGNEYFYIFIDYIFESDELVEGAGLIKQNIQGKPASEVLATKSQHQHKIVTLPCYESKIILDRYESDGYIFNFKMNLSWKNYLKGVRSIPEDDIFAEYIGPFYIGVLMKDENDIMRFVAGTFVSQHEEKTQQ